MGLRQILLPGLLFFQLSLAAQTRIMQTEDSMGIEISGYLDAYYGYDFLRPHDDTEPYVYSSTKHNELDINVGFVNLYFNHPRVHASFTPAIGTFIEINYAPEPSFWRHLYECYGGVKPLQKSNWWLDVGVFTAPFTNESAISMDHLTYTRSLGSENSPYYLSGLRSIHQINRTWKFTGYFLNGWQRIRKINEYPAFASDLEYKPSLKWQLNWTTFLGDSRSKSDSSLRNRYFTDVHAVYNMDGKVSASVCVTAGQQNHVTNGGQQIAEYWNSAALQLRWRFAKQHAVAVKYDQYNDPNGVILPNVVVPLMSNPENRGVNIRSVTLNYTWQFMPKAMFRIEGRALKAAKAAFLDHHDNPVTDAQMVVSSLAFKF